MPNVSAYDPAGVNAHTHFAYDAFGNLDVVTDANNHTTDYDYDALGWLNKVTNPLGYVTKHTYDANGNVIKTERQANDAATVWQTTEFTYDILNKLKTVKDPLSRVTTYNYDANENLASVVDAELNATNYVYDERDLLFTVTDANTPAGVTTYDYDLNGNLARHTTPSGQPIDYSYDALNRLTTKTYPLTPALNTTYAYDLGARMTAADNAASNIDFAYDVLNRVIATTQHLSPDTYNLSYQYDSVGNRTQLIYSGGKTLGYTYDNNDRFSSIKHQGSSFVNYAYDPLYRRTQKSYLSASLPLASYSYDIANQLASVTNTLVSGTPISQYSYPLYDNVGNRKTLQFSQGSQPQQTINYGYNDIYELTSVSGDQTNSYDYDPVGNRELADGVSYTPNNLNQYTNVGGNTLLYDNNENMIFDGVSKNYTYDELNRLVTFSDGVTNASYTYDAFNRRVSKTVNGVTTYFVYDGDEIIADYDGTGALVAEYINGDNIDEVLAMERGGNTYYYHQDGLGSVTELTDAAGFIVENYNYDPYGNSSIVNSAIGNRYRFTGREFDEESGIYHYRARAYDSMIGRFLQRDPIEYMDSINLHEYVHNNPVNYSDPTGQAWWIPIIEGVLFAYDTYQLYKTETDPCASNFEKNVVRAAWVTGVLSFGGGTTLAAKRIAKEAAERAANRSAWKLGGNKTAQKWANQLKERGWASGQIDEAIIKGKSFKAPNNINPQNGATRYVHPKTQKSVVIDNVTKEIIHVGDKGFNY